jgi:hypothetical protein
MPAGGGMLQRGLLCMSSSAYARSVAQAMECQFLPCPRVSLEMPVKAGLGASAVEAMIAGGAWAVVPRILSTPSRSPNKS